MAANSPKVDSRSSIPHVSVLDPSAMDWPEMRSKAIAVSLILHSTITTAPALSVADIVSMVVLVWTINTFPSEVPVITMLSIVDADDVQTLAGKSEIEIASITAADFTTVALDWSDVATLSDMPARFTDKAVLVSDVTALSEIMAAADPAQSL